MVASATIDQRNATARLDGLREAGLLNIAVWRSSPRGRAFRRYRTVRAGFAFGLLLWGFGPPALVPRLL